MKCLVKYLNGYLKGKVVMLSYHQAEHLYKAKMVKILKVYDNETVYK